MRYRETLLAPSASGAIEAVWSAQADSHDASLVLPDGRSDLILRKDANGAQTLRLTHPTAVAHRVPASPGTSWTGFRLRPGAARALWDHFDTRKDVSGADLLRAIPELRTPDLGRALESLAAARPNTLIAALAIIHETGGNSRIEALSKECGVSARSLSRLFHDWIGMSPKSYSQIVRFRRALSCLGTYSASEVAYLAGYADQAHMSRDFKVRLGTQSTRGAAVRAPDLPH